MKYILKILLFLAILITVGYLLPAFNVFTSITQTPAEWQGGISVNSTIVWAITIIIGYSYLMLQSLLGLFGLLFAFKKRRAAFWLLLLPGFLGILLAIIWLVLFILFDAEWPASWQVVAVPFAAPLLAYINGLFVRKKLVPKIKK